jgi:hypothetical protein
VQEKEQEKEQEQEQVQVQVQGWGRQAPDSTSVQVKEWQETRWESSP